MLKLLRLYVGDYLKKLFITFVLSIIAGVVLFYPLAENITEQILFMNWALYIAMYGVFFYHFPLTNIVKWSVNLPLKKRDLIIFNMTYQLIKIITTVGCIVFAFWAEYQLFQDNIYVGQINDNLNILKEYAVNREASALTRGFLSTMKLMILILSVSFFFTFIFNVAPYGPFKNKLITFRDSIEYIKYRVKKFNYHDLFILALSCLFLFILPFLYSKAFIAGFFVTCMLCILYFTYEKALTFSKSVRFYCLSLSIFIGLYTWLGLINHAKNVLQRQDLTTIDKIEEWEFLNQKHFQPNPVRKLALYLSDPKLCDDDIRKIFFYFRKKYHIAVDNVFRFEDSFEKIILSKNQCGLKSISKTIDPQKMTANMFIQYFDKWRESSIRYSPAVYKKITSPFLKRKFNKNEMTILINSKNPIAQFFALESIKTNPNTLSIKELEALAPQFVEGGLFAFKDFINTSFCQSYGINEIQSGRVRLNNHCRRQRQISSIIEE